MTTCVERLIAANIGNDVVALDEVAHLLDEIHSAWKEIAPTHPGA
ncbi:MAG: flagellar protein FliS [Propionivibrio sp.]